jgi:CRP-like cAMP-binding protein
MLAFSRLATGQRLSPASSSNHRRWRAREMVAREGDRPEFLLVITQGWAARVRILRDGIRQITALYIPGDICELFWLEESPVAQPIVALTELRGTAVPAAEIRQRAKHETPLRNAIFREAQWTAEARSEWMANLARRDSTSRIAHLFCELLTRQRAAGLASGNCCDLPLTQHDLADLLGITPIHTNRTLQALRADGLIELRGKRLRVLDIDRLTAIAGFDERYLSPPGALRTAEFVLSPTAGEMAEAAA